MVQRSDTGNLTRIHSDHSLTHTLTHTHSHSLTHLHTPHTHTHTHRVDRYACACRYTVINSLVVNLQALKADRIKAIGYALPASKMGPYFLAQFHRRGKCVHNQHEIPQMNDEVYITAQRFGPME